jgi:hypothetical protein
MTASIRGHQAVVKLFRNGLPAGQIPITKFNISQDSTFSRSFYVGQPHGEGDQSQEGWSGSFDVEVKGGEVDTLIDAMVNAKLNGVGVDEITIVDTELYADGTSQTYVYIDVQAKMSKSVGGINEKVTKKLDWQASLRKAV